jgi:protocatechuate 3,4-dioxygenase alpha subunit
MALDNKSPELFGQTPSQTVGPFFHYGLPWKGGGDLIGDSPLGARPELMPPEHYVLAEPSPKGPFSGEAIEISGRVIDADGLPVPDALIEIWQADAAGWYGGSNEPRGFIGYGRCATCEAGEYLFRTLRPGRVPGPGGVLQAAHIAVGILGRGLLKRLNTRLYFEDGEGLGADPVLQCVPAERRSTLWAKRVRGVPAAYRFDIVLQGPEETVFFDL